MAKLSDRIGEDAKAARASGDLVVGRTKTFTIILALGVLVLMAAFTYMIGNSIARPLGQTIVLLKDIAEGEGDLTARLEVKSRDEIGEMAEWFNVFVEKIQNTVQAIGGNIQSLAGSAEELTTVSQQMSSNSEEMAAQANVVSAASDEVSRNVQTVAAGSEEMSASIKEIAKNTNEAARVAKEAVEVVAKTNTTISKLGNSSAEIGNVIKVITSIAEQTNLLALNATIEAARAGEAGKGFAVVANEVKELAKQTGDATEDISNKIGAIQHDTQGAVAAIQQISTIINQVNDIANTIASAVEEQSVTTNEMSRNVSEASKGSNEIVANITGVAQAAQSTASGATETLAASQELARLAADLQTLVGQFKYDDEAQARIGDKMPTAVRAPMAERRTPSAQPYANGGARRKADLHAER
jgi:methyl-accepting chemotaxis protein